MARPSSVLPVDFELIVDGSNAIDCPQGFLGHLLFEKALNPSLQDQMPPVSAEMNPALVEMGVPNDELAGKICQIG